MEDKERLRVKMFHPECYDTLQDLKEKFDRSGNKPLKNQMIYLCKDCTNIRKNVLEELNNSHILSPISIPTGQSFEELDEMIKKFIHNYRDLFDETILCLQELLFDNFENIDMS